jgi:hypothetical protein
MLCHRHAPHECRTAFAAWRGFASPVRHRLVLSSCVSGSHTVWLMLEAPDSEAALSTLPPYVAERTSAVEVSEVPIP